MYSGVWEIKEWKKKALLDGIGCLGKIPREKASKQLHWTGVFWMTDEEQKLAVAA